MKQNNIMNRQAIAYTNSNFNPPNEDKNSLN